MEILLLGGSALLLFLAGFDYFWRRPKIGILEIQKLPVAFEANRVSGLIRTGGFACLKSQHSFLLLAFPVVLFALKQLSNDYKIIGFLSGLISCLALVYFSFATATIGNLSTALECMKSNGLQPGFIAARKAGNTIAMFISGILLLLLFISSLKHSKDLVVGCSFGISLVTIFTRLAGGIFTKSADIGGDLVGKIHADLPEDSPKNPAVIADNIGDNIGDCVGTAADVLETFSIFLLALGTCVISDKTYIMTAFLASYLASLWSINSSSNNLEEYTKKGVMDAINNLFKTALFLAPVIFLVLMFFFFLLKDQPQNLLSFNLNYLGAITSLSLLPKQCICFGLGILTVISTLYFNWYYTADAAPVRQIIGATRKGGAAMNIITSYFIGLESVFVLILSNSFIVMLAYLLLGITGVFICTASALGFIPCVMSMDAYGPIVDNAGGICVMSGAQELARQNTDILDSLGNTMKALTKGYSGCMTFISSSLLLCGLLTKKTISLDSSSLFPFLLSIILGIASIFMFGSLVMRGVFYGADYMVKVTLMKMKNESPDNPVYYTQPIKFLSRKSVQYAVLPMISCIGPIFFFLILNLIVPNSNIFGFLIGITSGIALSIKMTVSGGALDNAKKTIETEIGSELHVAETELEVSLTEFESSGTRQIKPIHELLEEVTSGLSVIQKNTDIDSDETTFLIRKLKNQIGVIKMESKASDPGRLQLSKGISLILGKAEAAPHPIFTKLKALMDLRAVKNNAVVGDTVGDPLKDAAGVSINNMIKLSTILSILLFQWI